VETKRCTHGDANSVTYARFECKKFSQRGGGASFHELHHLVPLFPSSHDAHERRTHQLPRLLRLQLPLLSCACGHALGPSLPCASHAIYIINSSYKTIMI